MNFVVFFLVRISADSIQLLFNCQSAKLVILLPVFIKQFDSDKQDHRHKFCENEIPDWFLS